MAIRATREYVEVLSPGDGKLRATRQYVEVLAIGTGKLRATRQYVEVLSDNPIIHTETPSHSLGLTDEAKAPHKFGVGSNTLAFTQVANASYLLSVSHVLGLISKAARAITASATNTLVFVDDANFLVHYNDFWPAANTLNFQQGIEIGGHKFVEDPITFIQTAEGRGPLYRPFLHRLTFSDEARSHNIYIDVTNSLILQSIAPISIEASVSNTLSFTDAAWRSCVIEHSLNLNQSMTWGKFKGLPVQDLNLISGVEFGGDWVRSITHDLNIGHSLTYFFDTACDRKSYRPFVGESTVNTTTPPDDNLSFIQAPAGLFKLEYPALGVVADSIALRAPELDNIDRNAINRVNRETRGGRLVVFADPTWPKVNTLKITFIGLTKAEAVALQQFLLDHIGEDLLLTDWEGREWIGIITTPDDAITQSGKLNWSATLTFDGVLLDACTPDTGLNLIDNMTFNCDRLRLMADDLNLTQVANYTVI